MIKYRIYWKDKGWADDRYIWLSSFGSYLDINKAFSAMTQRAATHVDNDYIIKEEPVKV